MKNLDILFEDSSVIIINKPAGLAVQGGKGVKTSLDKILTETYKGISTPLLVHRLDKDTSGVLLAAKGRESAAKFSKILGQERSAQKIYTAICCGHPDNPAGIIACELDIRGKNKKSETKYKIIKTGTIKLDDNTEQNYSVLKLELNTGRMHQIRRHLAMIGNPVLGDDHYGDFALNKKLKKSIKLKRLLLHANRLIIKNENIDVTAPLPDAMLPFT